MVFRRRRGPKIAPGLRLTDCATQRDARNGLPLALDLLAILVVLLAVLTWVT